MTGPPLKSRGGLATGLAGSPAHEGPAIARALTMPAHRPDFVGSCERQAPDWAVSAEPVAVSTLARAIPAASTTNNFLITPPFNDYSNDGVLKIGRGLCGTTPGTPAQGLGTRLRESLLSPESYCSS